MLWWRIERIKKRPTRIGPSYVKLVQRFVYLVAKVAVKLPS